MLQLRKELVLECSGEGAVWRKKNGTLFEDVHVGKLTCILLAVFSLKFCLAVFIEGKKRTSYITVQ
jgi:hypothetical protein